MSRTTVKTKLLALVGVLLTLVAVGVLLLTPPADGYEPSIYGALPWYFWTAVVGAILVGTSVVVQNARSEAPDRTWLFGLGTVFVVNALLIAMPYIRGYPIYGRGDVLTHIGFIRNITEQGFVSSSNIYPNLHLLVQTLSYATGIDPMYVINLVPIAFSVTYFGSMALLVSKMFDRRRLVLFGWAVVAIPSLGTAFLNAVPFTMSMLFVPFVLFLFVEEQQRNTLSVRVALVTAIVSIVIYHPLTTLFLIVTLAFYWVAKRTRRFSREYVGPTNVASLTLVVFVAWYVTFPGIVFRFESIFDVFVNDGGGASTLESYSSTVSETQPELIDLIRIAAYKYGVEGVAIALGVGFVVVALALWWRGRYEPNIYTTTFGAVFLTFVAASVVFFTMDLIVGFGRPLLLSRILALPLAGAFIYLVWRISSRHGDVGTTAFNVALVAVLVVFVYLSVFTVYYSPQSTQMNHQVTEMEITGSEWVFEHRNEDLLIDEFGVSQERLYDFHYGTDADRQNIRESETGPPDHFNYTTRQYLGESYDSDRYLLLTEFGRVTYPAKFPDYEQYWGFTPEDFDRLEYDPSVTRSYDNGEFNGYLINETVPQ
jgi:hypothetical protein